MLVKCSLSQAPSALIRFQTKTELFCSVFKKICVHTYRLRIVFARPHCNDHQERSHMEPSSGLAPGRVYLDDVTVFRQHRFHCPHQKTAFSKGIVFKSLHSGERFRMTPFSVIVFGVVVWTIAVSGAKQLRFRLKRDQCGRGLRCSVGWGAAQINKARGKKERDIERGASHSSLIFFSHRFFFSFGIP